MVLASMVRTQPLSFLPGPFSNTLFSLLFGGASAFLLSYALMFSLIFLAHKFGWIRKAEPGRKQDTVPRLGGLAIYLAFVIASLLFYLLNPAPDFHTGDFLTKERTIYWLFLAASTLIVAVHAYDDVRPLKPLPKLLAQTVAVIIILGPWFADWTFHGVLLFGFSNPLQAIHWPAVHGPLPIYERPIITLFIERPEMSLLAIPAVLFTWFWMVGMMNTVNLIDGVDGLAGGVVAITAIFIAITSWTLQQYTIAILSAIFAGAVLGFLPHNWNPAKIIMGDSGSQFLGLGLAVLSIMGGAKVALALMVLGIPILDVAVVMINRIRRGQSPLHYDTTHLHHRLRATGLSPRQICYVFYGFTALFGVLALRLFFIYKLVGIALVIATMAALIIWIDSRQRRRGTPIKLDRSDPGGIRPSTDQAQGICKEGAPQETPSSTDPSMANVPQHDSAGGGPSARLPL